MMILGWWLINEAWCCWFTLDETTWCVRGKRAEARIRQTMRLRKRRRIGWVGGSVYISCGVIQLERKDVCSFRWCKPYRSSMCVELQAAHVPFVNTSEHYFNRSHSPWQKTKLIGLQRCSFCNTETYAYMAVPVRTRTKMTSIVTSECPYI